MLYFLQGWRVRILIRFNVRSLRKRRSLGFSMTLTRSVELKKIVRIGFCASSDWVPCNNLEHDCLLESIKRCGNLDSLIHKVIF